MSGKNYRKGLPLLPVLALTALLITGTAAAQSGVPADTTPAKAPATHKLTEAAFAAGALTCAKRINDVSNYLSGTASNSAILFAPASAPDRHPLSASFELAGSGQGAYVSATFSPGPGGECDASYDAVIWWPNNCDTVARSGFAALKPQPALHKKVRILDGGSSMKVFLMPAGEGCVSIKKEVIR